MKCSQHPDADATAVCVACGRAVCGACWRTATGERVVCSADCAAAVRRRAAVESAEIENLRLTARSYHGGAVVLKLLAAVCLVTAIGEMAAALFLRNWLPVLHVLDPYAASGFAVVLLLLAGVCYVGARILVAIARRYDEALSQLD